MRFKGSYQIAFSPAAWRKVGLMPTASFQAFQEKVGQLATQLGPAQPAEGPSHSDLRAELEGFTVIYQRDDKTRTLTVEDILPASPKPPNS